MSEKSMPQKPPSSQAPRTTSPRIYRSTSWVPIRFPSRPFGQFACMLIPRNFPRAALVARSDEVQVAERTLAELVATDDGLYPLAGLGIYETPATLHIGRWSASVTYRSRWAGLTACRRELTACR